MNIAAALIGVIILVEGVVGVAAPGTFPQLITALREPPLIYAAALVRILFGVVLFRAAPASRLPTTLRLLGALLLLGGVLTPFLGAWLSKVVLGWWSQGDWVVRVFAGIAVVLGGLVLCAALGMRPGRESRA
jgi:hypothetical protein